MKFTITAIFCGICGDKAVISQEGQARLVNYHCEAYGDLWDSIFTIKKMDCELDSYGYIWIRSIKEVKA